MLSTVKRRVYFLPRCVASAHCAPAACRIWQLWHTTNVSVCYSSRYRMHSSRERSAASCLMICNAERTDWQCQSGFSGIRRKAADDALEEVSISRGNWQKLRRRKGGNTWCLLIETYEKKKWKQQLLAN